VEELLNHPSGPVYFPAYELLMDDLRDYRFYNDDMLHPSSAAVEYIWNVFTDCWFDPKTSAVWKEVNNITKAVSHKITSGRVKEIKAFAEKMILKINKLQSRNAGLNLEKERKYFLDLQGF
jgi:hypothetical protein